MSPTLRRLTILLALFYFLAAAYHTGLVLPAGALPPATIAEALLGLVLLAAGVGVIRSALIAYVLVMAGTLFGLAIVIARGLLGVDLAIHVVMLIGLATGLVLILSPRR